MPRGILIAVLIGPVCCAALWAAPATSEAKQITMKPPGEKQRDGLGNIFSKLQRGGELKVGYFGASVTNGAGATSQDKKWRWIVHHWLEEQYPQAKLAHLHVVNGGTGSDLGACRIGREMLSQDPDLLFIEFAVNDGGRPQGYVLRTMEGIIRQIWRADPTTDVILLYTINTRFLKAYEQDQLPGTTAAFETVADHYGVPSIDVGYVAAQKLMAHELTWEEFSVDSVHPTDRGYRIYGDHIIACLDKWRQGATAKPHKLPPPLNADNWEDATMIPAKDCRLSAGWTTDTSDLAKRYPHFPDLQLATQPGETLKFKFRGTHFGVYDVVGKDSGMLDVFVDGHQVGTVNLWDRYCRHGWRSAFRLLGRDLQDTVHEVELRISDRKDEQSTGHAMRLGFITMKGQPVK